MTVRGRLSPVELTLIEGLTERGLSTGRIAQKLRRSSSTIHGVKVRCGLVAPRERRFAYLRKGKPVVSFDPDEDAFLLATRAAGHPYRVIAKAIESRFGRHRSPQVLRVRLIMLANRAEAS